jgi:hypothetical protein
MDVKMTFLNGNLTEYV